MQIEFVSPFTRTAEKLELSWAKYGDESHCLTLNDLNGSLYGRATTCVDGGPDLVKSVGLRLNDCIIVKTWSENEGIYECLVSQGVIQVTSWWIKCGFAYARVGILTEAAKNSMVK